MSSRNERKGIKKREKIIAKTRGDMRVLNVVGVFHYFHYFLVGGFDRYALHNVTVTREVSNYINIIPNTYRYFINQIDLT